MDNNVQCPVDFVLMNENKARLTAFFVLVLLGGFLATGLWIIVAFLIIDFFLRVMNLGKYSLLGILSDVIIKQFKIENKPTDRAPKRFAAGVGLLFTLSILGLVFLQLTTLSIILTSIVVVFAFLESFLSFCAGCYVYAVLKKASNLFKSN